MIYHAPKDRPEKVEIGTTAQALPEKFPEPVKKDKKGYYTVRYDKLSILALRGIASLSRDGYITSGLAEQFFADNGKIVISEGQALSGGV